MGFDMKNTMIMAKITTAAITFTFPQDIPEKLPSDQLWRLTILESSAKVTTKSVIAEQIYPIITPLMTSMDITSKPEKRVVARQMHKAILDYMNSDAFRPTANIAPELIQELFTKVAGDVKSYTKDSPDELKPKIN